jgi:hypothetical protein
LSACRLKDSNIFDNLGVSNRAVLAAHATTRGLANHTKP